MRITGGEFRGRNISPPKNLSVRPTTDFAKTALFNILSNHFDFEELYVLDLFAGAGSITYEFVSRGVRSVTSVDESFHCISFIKKTAELLKANNIKTIRYDAFKYLKNATEQFDIIFADPPFVLESTDKIPDLVREKKLLKENGWLIVEHQAKRELISSVTPDEVRKYGNCAFSIYK